MRTGVKPLVLWISSIIVSVSVQPLVSVISLQIVGGHGQ
jgi:hypothetical protein